MKRLSKNILSLASADLARRFLGFISVAYLARILGKEGFGAINLGFAVLAYSMVLGAAGFPTLGVKKAAQGERAEFVNQVFGGRIISTIIVLALIILVVVLTVPNASIARLIILFSCAVLPQIFFLDWFFQGKETLGIVSAARGAQAVVYLAVVLIFVRTPGDILWVAFGSIAGECTAAAMLFIKFRSVYSGVHIIIKPSIQLIKQSIPLAIGVILATVVINYPQIALGIFGTTSNIGIYSAASKLVFFLLMGDRILILLLLPASARTHHYSLETYKELLRYTIRWIIILGLPIAAGGTIVAEALIMLVFGAEYSASAVVLKVLIWYFLLTMVHTIYTSGLIGAGGEKLYGKIMVATACAYFLCVSAGTYWFGPLGAACGVVLAEGFGLILIDRALRSIVPLRPPEKLLRVFCSVILMGAIVSLVAHHGLVWAFLVGAGSYFLLLMSLRAVVWTDFKTLLAKFS